MNRTVRILLIFVLVTGWIFSGWPRIWNNPAFPPEIQKAQAALPTFVACGAGAGAAGAITPALPTGIATNDILLLFLETANEAISIPTPNGGTWTEVLNSPQGTGTAAATGATRLTVFWSRYNGTQGNPTTSDSGDHQVGAICAYNGVITTGNPWDVTSGAVDTVSDTSGTIPGATTTGDDRLVVIAGAGDDDADTPVTTVANTDLANISAARVNAETALGNDGGVTVFDGQKASAGAYGNTTLTYTGATIKGMMTIALKPPPPTTTLGDGTNPGDATISPGGAATENDSFTFQTSAGTDTITAATTTLAANTTSSIAEVAITSNDGATVYGSSTNPTSNSFTITLNQNTLTATSTSAVQYKIRITPKSHADMPPPPGSTYTVTSTITDWTGTNSHLGSDATSSVLTIDNLSPANVSGASGTAGNTQVTLSWTNPGDSDFTTTTVLRATSTIGDTAPVEGTNYATSSTVNATTTVACAVGGGASANVSCIDTGLTNGTAYHYKIFSQDSRGNYATGTVPTGSPFTPFAATVSCSTNIASVSFGTLTTSSISTASLNASTTMTCTHTLGCTLSIQDLGNGSNPGLATSSPAYLIPSATDTLSAGTEGYGIQAATTASGSGGTLGINPIYDKAGNDVGGLTTGGALLASSTIAITNREVVVTHKAAISVLTNAASYVDTITYSCLGN